MNTFVKTALGNIAKVFVKKVTVVDQEGDEVTKTRPREGVKGLGWITGFIIAWHFFIQPILAHYFPDIEFPTLDGAG